MTGIKLISITFPLAFQFISFCSSLSHLLPPDISLFVFSLLFVFLLSPCVSLQTPTLTTTGTQWPRQTFSFSLSPWPLWCASPRRQTKPLSGWLGRCWWARTAGSWGGSSGKPPPRLGSLQHIHTASFAACLFIFLSGCCTALTSLSQSSCTCKHTC